MGTLQINVLGTSFAIQAKEDSTYLENLLNYYTQKTEQIERDTGLKDQLKKAILSGIMLCDELYKEKKRNISSNQSSDDDTLHEAERLTLEMIDKINNVL